MTAIHGATVSADLPGTVDQIKFDSGKWVTAGDVLVELDTRQAGAQLAGMEAQRDLTKINYARMEQLVNEGVISRLDYDKAMADQKQDDANAAEVRAAIARKTIRAPFSGVLGIRQANLGQYLAAGSAILPLQSLNPIYVTFSVPQQAIAHVQTGQTVRITSDDFACLKVVMHVDALATVDDQYTRHLH